MQISLLTWLISCILPLAFSAQSYGQLLWSESFETDGSRSRYIITNGYDDSNNNTDYFARVDPSVIASKSDPCADFDGS